jgi:hypothetical protein
MPPRRRHRGAKNGDSPGDSGDAVTPPTRRSKDRSAPLVSRGGQSRGQGRARASPADTEEGRRRLAQAEYDTEIHFQKCYGVMTEVFEAHQSFPALPEAFHFLDLGCAPGGFSTYLLNDARCAMGYGVTLSAESGGFPARIMKHAKANRYALQYGDLFRMEPKELAATSNIYFVIADAQYLNDGLAYAEAGRYTGARCSTKQNGIWALTLKQMWLGFDRLETGGSFMIRFGWKDYGDQWSVWYKACALRLFQLLYAVFGDGDGPPAAELFGGAGPDGASFSADLNAVRCCKSSYFNTSTSSFYIVASGFRRQAYLDLKVAELLRKEIDTLTAKDSGDHDILDVVVVAEDVSTKVEEELAKIEKLREIGENTKKWTNSQGQVGRGLEVGAAGMRTVCVQPLLVKSLIPL